MKVKCVKRWSDASNFSDGKIYECYHQKGKEYVKTKWIIDNLGITRCILPDGSHSPHLPTGMQMWPIPASIGCFELVDDSPSQELWADPFTNPFPLKQEA